MVLPGVGSFGDCYRGLESRRLVEAIKGVIASGRPFLGICIGLQLLLDGSEETPDIDGLGIIPGAVRRFEATPERKVPHMGWNQLRIVEAACPLLKDVPQGSFCYFVHSYYAVPDECDVVAATCEYGVEFPAVLWRDSLFATQFHPEKSQKIGLRILRNFARLAAG